MRNISEVHIYFLIKNMTQILSMKDIYLPDRYVTLSDNVRLIVIAASRQHEVSDSGLALCPLLINFISNDKMFFKLLIALKVFSRVKKNKNENISFLAKQLVNLIYILTLLLIIHMIKIKETINIFLIHFIFTLV